MVAGILGAVAGNFVAAGLFSKGLYGVFGVTLVSTIWAMMAACFLPFVFTVVAKVVGGFKPADNKNPRAFLAKTNGKAARANAAQANSFETLPMFLAAVLLALYVFVPLPVINSVAWLYVLLRAGFGLAYLLDRSLLRSVLWALSMVCIFALFCYSLRVMW